MQAVSPAARCAVCDLVAAADSYRTIHSFMDVHLAQLRDAFDAKWRKAPPYTTIRGILQQPDPPRSKLRSACRAGLVPLCISVLRRSRSSALSVAVYLLTTGCFAIQMHFWTTGNIDSDRPQDQRRAELALQLRISVVSESMGNHDSGDHGCRVPRSRRRWSSGRRHCGM